MRGHRGELEDRHGQLALTWATLCTVPIEDTEAKMGDAD